MNAYLFGELRLQNAYLLGFLEEDNILTVTSNNKPADVSAQWTTNSEQAMFLAMFLAMF